MNPEVIYSDNNVTVWWTKPPKRSGNDVYQVTLRQGGKFDQHVVVRVWEALNAFAAVSRSSMGDSTECVRIEGKRKAIKKQLPAGESIGEFLARTVVDK
jgi:hypothetical protein